MLSEKHLILGKAIFMKSGADSLSFEDLLKLVRQLSKKEKEVLRTEIDSELSPQHNSEKSDFQKLLLKGPTISEDELHEIEKARNELNQWRNQSA